MDTAAAVGKTPMMRCSRGTLLAACPGEKSSIRGVSYLGREDCLGKSSGGCRTVVKAVKQMFLCRIASIKLLHLRQSGRTSQSH